MNEDSSRTLYDEIRYPARSFEYAHPNRLGTIAALYGMTPTPIPNCRVLELGCGVGGNIIPMAYQNPKSQFVGIDLSGDAVSVGRMRIGALALRNISLHHLDILDVSDQFGSFDYIIAHGVYSWVPAHVRQKILAISKQLLNPQGVSYVSYNAHPYSHMRDMVRDMMLFHTRHLSGSTEKIGQARAIAKFLSDASADDTVHGKVMRAQNLRIERLYNEVLFHDDLNASAEPFLLHRFVEAAEEHGLQYLGDVDFSRQDISNYSEAAISTLLSFPPEALMVRDQYQDFIDGSGFRRTLLCHEDNKLRRTLADDFIKRFFLSAPMKSKADHPQADGETDTFQGSYGAAVAASTPTAKAAFLCLGDAWPHSLTFDELAERTFARLGPAGQTERCEATIADLCTLLAGAARRGEIVFRFDRPHIVSVVNERPEASPVARAQSQAGETVTNLLHSSVLVGNTMSRQLLASIDGTRTVDELQAEANRLNSISPEGTSEAPDVNNLLLKLAKSALLVR
jgi:SAM-dependent methyltransferase